VVVYASVSALHVCYYDPVFTVRRSAVL